MPKKKKKRHLLISIYRLLSPPHSSWMNRLHLLCLYFLRHSPPTSATPPPPQEQQLWLAHVKLLRSDLGGSFWSLFIWQTWHQRLLSPSGNTFCPQFLRPSLSSCFSDFSSISSASISLIDHSWWYPRFSYVSSPPFSLYILSGLVHPLSSCQLPFIWGLLPQQNLQHRSPFTAPDQYT